MKYRNRYMRALFNRINSELFNDELPACHLYALTSAQLEKVAGFPIDGICIPEQDDYFIGLDNSLAEGAFFNTMVHEMIHVWQMENKKSIGHYGWFIVWCEKAREEFYNA